jgi:hypothetical protein
MHRSTLLAFFLLPVMLAASGCEFVDPSDWGESNRYHEDFNYDFKLAAGGRLEVESFNGSVEVVGWDSDSVQIRGTKNAARQETLHSLAIDAKADPGEVRVRAIRPTPNCNCGVSFVLHVPRKVHVDRLETSNASVRLESLEGPARVQTSNGSIKLFDLKGDVDATTSNASIEADRLDGAMTLRSSNGRIRAQIARGSIEAHTSNSSIDITADEADAGRPVILSTSNGSVNFSLATWKGNEIRATTSNSSVNLKLPEKLDARVHATTTNGHIDTDYEVTTSHLTKSSLEGRIGQGGGLIDDQTSNGNVRISKR